MIVDRIDPEMRTRIGLFLFCSACLALLLFDPSIVEAARHGTSKMAALNQYGEDAYASLADYSIPAACVLVAAGVICMLAGREAAGYGAIMVASGFGVAVIQYVPDFMSIFKQGHGGLL